MDVIQKLKDMEYPELYNKNNEKKSYEYLTNLLGFDFTEEKIIEF